MRPISLKLQRREIWTGSRRSERTHILSGEWGGGGDLHMDSSVKAKYPCILREECSGRQAVKQKFEDG